MQIVCPNCATSYDIAASALGADGRSVRCVRCRTVWFAATAGPGAGGAAAPSAAAIIPPANADPLQQKLARRGGRTEGEAPHTSDTGARLSLADAIPAGVAVAISSPDQTPLVDPGAVGLGMQAKSEPVVAQPPSWDALAEAPPLAPMDHDATSFEQPAPELAEHAARRALRKSLRSGRQLATPSWSTVILSLLVVIGAILAWRAEMVRALPQTASLFATVGLPVNLRGLAFSEVRTSGEVHEGVPVLIVEGTISNITKARIELPRLRVALRDGTGREVHTWTTLPEAPMLGGGEGQPFRTRLASPPAEGREVVVRFLNRRDVENGLR